MSNTLQILEGLDNVPKKIQKQMIKNTKHIITFFRKDINITKQICAWMNTLWRACKPAWLWKRKARGWMAVKLDNNKHKMLTTKRDNRYWNRFQNSFWSYVNAFASFGRRLFLDDETTHAYTIFNDLIFFYCSWILFSCKIWSFIFFIKFKFTWKNELTTLLQLILTNAGESSKTGFALTASKGGSSTEVVQ